MRPLIASMRVLASTPDAVPREIIDSRSHDDEGTRDELSIEIDANGSPVTLPEADWLVCFVPGLRKQWWHRFADAKHKHVFAMRRVDEDTWLIVEPWWTRLMVNVLSFDEAVKFLRWAAVGSMIKVRESIPGRGSQMRGWSNCAVLVSFLLGRSYWTWTPNGLYKKLLSEDGAQTVDLPQLLVEHVEAMTCKAVCSAMAPLEHGLSKHGPVPLENLLVRMGSGIVSSMMSAAAISLHQIVVSGSGRIRDNADAGRGHGMERTVGHIRGVLEEAQRHGEIHVADCSLAARQFIAMLRGDMQLEIIFGIRTSAPPATADIQAHVRSVVSIFLDGAGITRMGGKAG